MLIYYHFFLDMNNDNDNDDDADKNNSHVPAGGGRGVLKPSGNTLLISTINLSTNKAL